MKYLKKFNQASEYEAFKVGDEYITPNVSYVVDGSEVKFGPAVKPLVYNMVDLGLPSGLLWADRNIGASSPEDAGLYFAWGETKGYTAEQVANGEKVFDQNSFIGPDLNTTYLTSSDKILHPEDDAATVNMGSNWRMPIQNDFYELRDNTIITCIDVNGDEFDEFRQYTYEEFANKFIYIKLTSKINGNSILYPLSMDKSTYERSGYCSLWCGETAVDYGAPSFVSNNVTVG